ncbi:hypothetical protein [Lacisediminihabitans profunda]|uniref:Uncharacterized protein n=1 Tax=Lacisediminihabitans profunda TaxID=2594790 RepID=A0A5C8UXI1_9MICO|nr:hypothetical protein [Lacisediminihabitans profunda]TXN32331.1 hypothetical protein FVP33_01550 [Lacisediminihabitans profunda]
MLPRKLITTAGMVSLLTGALLVGMIAGPTAAEGSGHTDVDRLVGVGRFDTASSAIPTAAQPTAADRVDATAHAGRNAPKSVASAVATSNCDGCQGTATTFQVVYFDGSGPALADNTATAWSSCASCGASSVSVQLVVVRRAQPITVNNRALALNVACTGCSTSAAAIQFVIAGGTRRELSAQAHALIDQIQTELAASLAPAPQSNSRRLAAPQLESLATQAADRLQKIIVSGTGAASVQRSIDLKLGG